MGRQAASLPADRKAKIARLGLKRLSVGSFEGLPVVLNRIIMLIFLFTFCSFILGPDPTSAYKKDQ